MAGQSGRFGAALALFLALITVLGASGVWPAEAGARSGDGGSLPWDGRSSRLVAAATTTVGYVPIVRNGTSDPALGGTWRTGIQVFNLDGSQATSAQIRFVRPDGSQAAITQPATIAAGRSVTFFAGSLGVADGFTGSAAVTADRTIAVIVNQLSENTGQSGSFNAVATGSQRIFVPIAQRRADGFSSVLAIQNVGTAATARAEVRFHRLEQATPVGTVSLATIPPGATFELVPTNVNGLPDGFQGSAIVESDQPLAVVVNQSNGRSLLASTGQTTGAATLYGPLVMSNNGGFGSTLQVQNVGSAPTEVTVTAVDTATGAQLPSQRRTIPAGAAASWSARSLAGSDSRFVGSVTVQAASDGRLAGVVTQSNPSTNQATAYSLFDEGTAQIVAPLVQTANSGWDTGFQVQNVGTSAAQVTVQVSDTSGAVIGSVPNSTRTLAPGKSETWFPITAAGTRVVGSAIATGSPGSRLVGIVNQLNQSSGAVDFFTTYEAVSTAPSSTPPGSTPIPPAPTPVPPAATPVPPTDNWLAYVNFYRSIAGVAAVNEDASLSANCVEHARYMAENNHLTHDQNSSLPFASAAGQVCAKNGNVWLGGAFSRPIWQPKDSIDGWVSSVGHRLWLLYPTTPTFGYGFYTAANNAAAAGLDVISRANMNADQSFSGWPIRYPAPNQTGVPNKQYAVTLNWRYFGATPLVQRTSLTTAGGTAIAHTVTTSLPAGHKGIQILPNANLPANTVVNVSVEGTYDNAPFSFSWSFTTGQSTSP